MARDRVGCTRARRPTSVLRVALALAVALGVLAPMLLGPALSPLSRALGGAAQHYCACGMVAGTCGCPECERLERQRQLDQNPRPYPTLTSQCSGNEITAGFPALPPAVPPSSFQLPTSRPREFVASQSPPRARSRDPVTPPTPPPRALVI